jgi:hypothetical protein
VDINQLLFSRNISDPFLADHWISRAMAARHLFEMKQQVKKPAVSFKRRIRKSSNPSIRTDTQKRNLDKYCREK